MNSERLQQKMQEKNISEKDMYEALGISRSAFYRKKNGISEFKLKEIQKICQLLEVDSADDIFFNSKVS